jgi:hypothetical protein
MMTTTKTAIRKRIGVRILIVGIMENLSVTTKENVILTNLTACQIERMAQLQLQECALMMTQNA